MIVLNKIYTRTGDKGQTSLSDLSRVAKHDLRVEAYGTTDEANATVGLVRLHAQGQMDERLALIQNDLYDVGADLSRPNIAGDPEAAHPVLRVIAAQVDRLEAEIDEMNADLAPLRSFVLPGGNALAAHLHLARTITRRAERCATALAAETDDVNAEAIRFLNRLSDWLFVAARLANDGGTSEVLWKPGANRPDKA